MPSPKDWLPTYDIYDMQDVVGYLNTASSQASDKIRGASMAAVDIANTHFDYPVDLK